MNILFSCEKKQAWRCEVVLLTGDLIWTGDYGIQCVLPNRFDDFQLPGYRVIFLDSEKSWCWVCIYLRRTRMHPHIYSYQENALFFCAVLCVRPKMVFSQLKAIQRWVSPLPHMPDCESSVIYAMLPTIPCLVLLGWWLFCIPCFRSVVRCCMRCWLLWWCSLSFF